MHNVISIKKPWAQRMGTLAQRLVYSMLLFLKVYYQSPVHLHTVYACLLYTSIKIPSYSHEQNGMTVVSLFDKRHKDRNNWQITIRWVQKLSLIHIYDFVVLLSDMGYHDFNFPQLGRTLRAFGVTIHLKAVLRR